MRILFTPSGRRQFLEAIAYINRDKPSAAINFRKKVEKALSRLKKFPESGRPLSEFLELSFREIIVSPYRFFYKVKENDVWIVAVLHGAQLPDEPDNKKREKDSPVKK